MNVFPGSYGVNEFLDSWSFALADALRQHGFTDVRVVRVTDDRDPNGPDRYCEGRYGGEVCRFRSVGQLYDWAERRGVGAGGRTRFAGTAVLG
jgi:hypothetical protein